MKFVDLEAQQQRIRKNLEKRILKVLDHGHYVLGPEIEELEKRLADYVGGSHALACASGTDALLMALMAYEIGPGDAVFTTPFTFFATAEVISLLGATPVFVDIDPLSFNIDPTLLEAAIRDVANDERTHPVYRSLAKEEVLVPKAVIAVDLFGLPADYPAISSYCENIRPGAHRGCGPILRRRTEREKGLRPGGYRLHLLLSGQASGLLRGRRHVFYR